jgi:hypothetical protein
MVAVEFEVYLLSQIVYGFEHCIFSVMNYECLLQYHDLWIVQLGSR